MMDSNLVTISDRGERLTYTKKQVLTSKNFYEILYELPSLDISSLAQEHMIRKELLSGGEKDLARTPEYLSLAEGYAEFMWTRTGLRLPRNVNPLVYETVKGKRYWRRIILDGVSEIGEAMIPEGGRRAIVSYSDFGLPTETEEAGPENRGSAIFMFSPNARIDSFSQQRDAAVVLALNYDARTGLRLVIGAHRSRSDTGEGAYRIVKARKTVR